MEERRRVTAAAAADRQHSVQLLILPLLHEAPDLLSGFTIPLVNAQLAHRARKAKGTWKECCRNWPTSPGGGAHEVSAAHGMERKKHG
eukprot:1226130-Rhodomonas_salina.2